MSKLRFRKRFADRSELRHSRPRVKPNGKVQFETRLNRQAVAPIAEFSFSDFVITMKALALATVCLLVAFPLLILCGLMLYSLCAAT